MKGFIILTALSIIITITCWGPFPKCGEEGSTTVEECHKHSLKTNIGCCLAELQDSQKTKECILIGGRGQGWFNNQTNAVNLSNLLFPKDVANRTEEKTFEYALNNSKMYKDEPLARVTCMNNNVFSLKLTLFLVLAVLMIFL